MKKIVAVILCFVLMFSLVGCASMKRSWKSTKADWNGGLNRIVKVYDYNGNLIQTYEGKIDIADSEAGNIVFDLNNDNRIVISGGIVIIEEK